LPVNKRTILSAAWTLLVILVDVALALFLLICLVVIIKIIFG